MAVLGALTLGKHRSTNDARERQQNVVLNLTPGFVAEVHFAVVKVVLEASVILGLLGGVHLGHCNFHCMANVLSRLLFEDIRYRCIQERITIEVVHEGYGIKIIGEIKNLVVPDCPNSANNMLIM